jgi:hypothetical protein
MLALQLETAGSASVEVKQDSCLHRRRRIRPAWRQTVRGRRGMV